MPATTWYIELGVKWSHRALAPCVLRQKRQGWPQIPEILSLVGDGKWILDSIDTILDCFSHDLAGEMALVDIPLYDVVAR